MLTFCFASIEIISIKWQFLLIKVPKTFTIANRRL